MNRNATLCTALAALEAVEALIVDAQIRIAHLDPQAQRRLSAPITAAALLLERAREDIESVSENMTAESATRAALGAAAVVAIAGCGGSTTKTTDANQTTETTVTVSTSTATTTATAEPTATAMHDDMNMAKPYGAPPVPRMV